MMVHCIHEVRIGKNWPLLLALGGGHVLAVDSSECVGRVSGDGGFTWGEPFAIQVSEAPPDAAAGPPGDLGLKNVVPRMISSLCRLRDGSTGAVLRVSHEQIGFCRSADEGRMFTKAAPLGLPGECLEAINGLIQLRSGRLVAAVNAFIDDYEHPEYRGDGVGHSFRGAYGVYQGRRIIVEGHDHTPEFQWVEVFYSDDLGRSWQRSVNRLWAWLDNVAEHASYHSPLAEPVVVEVEDNRLLMFMRCVVGRVYQAESRDGGASWSIPRRTELPASGSPCMVRTIPRTDHLLIVWNNVSPEEIRRGLKRSRLGCAISKDHGRTWTHFKTVDVCSGLAPVGRIEPGPVRNYRADDDIERLPDDFGSFGYPDIAFVGENVLFAYSAQMMKPVAQWPEGTGILGDRDYFGKIRIVPIKSLYT